MTTPEIVGWLASGTMIATFLFDKKIYMRAASIMASCLFIAYASLLGLFPILALHLVLLPINCVKFIKLKNRQFKIKPKKKKVITDIEV